ncbi:hypothetical protein L1987_86944 [Smallanthus sonchifolius]|uniref:Uncharacterized protein n=1 Tax=Smallanthus sonchifolius TaxID=185202 RepID=A0ACB8XZZ3_9ASTR|nr:hypothetical protein L1987_86944 [Smallanthus sonchifolius]
MYMCETELELLGEITAPIAWKQKSFKFYSELKEKSSNFKNGLLDILFITGLNIDGHAATGVETDENIIEVLKNFVHESVVNHLKAAGKGTLALSSLNTLKKYELTSEESLKLFCFQTIRAVISPNNSSYFFLYEMVPGFATLMGAKNFRATEFPLMKQWSKQLYKSSQDTSKGHTKEQKDRHWSKPEGVRRWNDEFSKAKALCDDRTKFIMKVYHVSTSAMNERSPTQSSGMGERSSTQSSPTHDPPRTSNELPTTSRHIQSTERWVNFFSPGPSTITRDGRSLIEELIKNEKPITYTFQL